MKFKTLFLFIVLSSLLSNSFYQKELPKGFVYARDIVKDLDVELRYYSTNNFVGDTIDGYNANRLILTKACVDRLKIVQEVLQSNNMCLRVYDGYRPQKAVNHFIRWARILSDTVNKTRFYPNVLKRNLFKEEYIASRSGHSRGSTLDLSIIDGNTNMPLDMGSPFDFFGEPSWVDYEDITETQKKNRQLLQHVMLNHGFRNYTKEWWHFTLRDEPFPNTYFDFPVE